MSQNSNHNLSTINPTNNQSQTNSLPHSNPTFSYSNILKTEMFPTKENAIILQKQENFQITDYILGFSNITDLKNIIDAYPMSYNRIVIFFRTAQIASEITKKYTHININNIQVPIRSLISPSKRMIITVPAYIPHEHIKNILDSYNVKMTSTITHLKVSSDPRIAHINSGRRQVFVIPDEQNKMPDSVLTEYNDEQCRIFFTMEQCEICRRHGHTRDTCKLVRSTNPTNTDSNNPMEASIQTTANNTSKLQVIAQIHPTPAEATPEIQVTPPAIHPKTAKDTTALSQQNPAKLVPEATKKRPLPESPSDTTPDLIELQADKTEEKISKPEFKKPTPRTKKPKNSQEEEISLEEMLKPVRIELTNNPTKYNIEYNSFRGYIEDIWHSKNYLETTRKYSENIELMLTLMQNLYPILLHSKIKNRFTRIMNHIKKELYNLELSDDQYSSTSSAN